MTLDTFQKFNIREETQMSNVATAQLHYHSPNDERHDVPAEMLCKLVDAINVLTYLTASGMSATSARPIKTIADFRQDYQVSCMSPETGSFILPIELSKISEKAILDPAKIIVSLFTLLSMLQAGAVDPGNFQGMEQPARNLFVSQLQRMVPDKGSAWALSLDLLDDSSKSINISPDLIENAVRIMRCDDVSSEGDVTAVIGAVSTVDFVNNTLTLSLPKLGRMITCNYGPSTPIGNLFEAATGRLQVFGEFTYDEEDNPVACSRVTSVQPVDVSPIIVRGIRVQGHVLTTQRNYLRFTPVLDDETEQLFVVRRDDLGVDVFANNRRELIELVTENLQANWEQYVMSSDSDLCAEVLAIKNNLLAAFKEEPHA